MTYCTRCGKDNPAEVHTCSPNKANGFTHEFIAEYTGYSKDPFANSNSDSGLAYNILYNFLKRFDLIKE